MYQVETMFNFFNGWEVSTFDTLECAITFADLWAERGYSSRIKTL